MVVPDERHATHYGAFSNASPGIEETLGSGRVLTASGIVLRSCSSIAIHLFHLVGSSSRLGRSDWIRANRPCHAS
ncbi:MAG: hypothetical protein JAY91_08545 [Candidatus Thiodiazotropha endolucinida]|nr:hypothetical protein [Candidatus Thiodiazotropha taylori]